MTLFWIILAVTICFVACISCLLIYNAYRSIEEIQSGSMDTSLIHGEFVEKERDEKRRASRRFRKIAGIVLDVLIIILFLFFLLSFTDRIINSFSLPFQTMVVATGSMAEKNPANEYLVENDLNDQLQVDDLIGIEKVDSLDDVEVYDIVCYLDDEGKQIVHRVIQKREDRLITRGDANDASDPIVVNMDNLVGVYTHFRIPKVGILVFFVQSNYGILAFCGIFFILLVYDQCSRFQSRAEEKRKTVVKEQIGVHREYELVSESGTLKVHPDGYDYEGETTYECESYLLIDGNKMALPESEFSLWKTS